MNRKQRRRRGILPAPVKSAAAEPMLLMPPGFKKMALRHLIAHPEAYAGSPKEITWRGIRRRGK